VSDEQSNPEQDDVELHGKQQQGNGATIEPRDESDDDDFELHGKQQQGNG